MGMIPSNAQPIIDARRRGYKPADLILVSLIGRINEANHTVYVNSRSDYEWLWVRGLNICVYASPEVKWRDLMRSIASQRPLYLALWDADRREGADVWLLPHPATIDRPQIEWQWDLQFLPWLPFQNKGFAWN